MRDSKTRFDSDFDADTDSDTYKGAQSLVTGVALAKPVARRLGSVAAAKGPAVAKPMAGTLAALPLFG